jgi:hypothetical protein
MPSFPQSIGLTETAWSAMEQIAQAAHRNHQVLNRVLAQHGRVIPASRGVYPVQADIINYPAGGGALELQNTGAAARLEMTELSSGLQFGRQQLDREIPDGRHALLQEAGRFYARASDALLLYGDAADRSPRWPGSCVQNGGPGRVRLVDPIGRCVFSPGPTEYDHARALVTELLRSRANLLNNNCEGPFVAILSPDLFALLTTPAPSGANNLLQKLEEAFQGSKTARAGDQVTSSNSLVHESTAMNGHRAVVFCPSVLRLHVSYDGVLDIVNSGDPALLRLFGSFALEIQRPGAVDTLRFVY